MAQLLLRHAQYPVDGRAQSAVLVWHTHAGKADGRDVHLFAARPLRELVVSRARRCDSRMAESASGAAQDWPLRDALYQTDRQEPSGTVDAHSAPSVPEQDQAV